jgi:hypothetical protein
MLTQEEFWEYDRPIFWARFNGDFSSLKEALDKTKEPYYIIKHKKHNVFVVCFTTKETRFQIIMNVRFKMVEGVGYGKLSNN